MTTENQLPEIDTTIEIQPYVKTTHRLGSTHARSLKSPHVTKAMQTQTLSLRPTKSIKRKDSLRPTKKA